MGWRVLWRSWGTGLRVAATHARLRTQVVLAGAAILAGCASASEKIADTASSLPVVGLPANAPERPATRMTYPAVHDMPRARAEPLLNDVEQQRLEDDLVAARARHQVDANPEAAAANAAAAAAAAKKRPSASPPVIPASSGKTIY
jgi:hypothetical protein